MFQIKIEKRKEVLGWLAKLVPLEKYAYMCKTIEEIAGLYEGQDSRAIDILYRAAEENRFDEFVGKLRDYDSEKGKVIPIDIRGLANEVDTHILEDILQKSTSLEHEKVSTENIKFLPLSTRRLYENLEVVKMELFLRNCIKELAAHKTYGQK